MSPDIEADAVKRRSRANREDDTAKGGKSASFYWSSAALYPFQTFFPSPQALHMWHWQPLKKNLSMWSCLLPSHSMAICGFLPSIALSFYLAALLSVHLPDSLSLHGCYLIISIQWQSRCRQSDQIVPNTNLEACISRKNSKLGFQVTKFTKRWQSVSLSQNVWTCHFTPTKICQSPSLPNSLPLCATMWGWESKSSSNFLSPWSRHAAKLIKTRARSFIVFLASWLSMTHSIHALRIINQINTHQHMDT